MDYINEIDKEKKYKKASECGFYDPYDYFLVGDSGGFLMNIDPTAKFVNTELLQEVGIYLIIIENIQLIKKILFLIDNLDVENNIDVNMVLMLLVLN